MKYLTQVCNRLGRYSAYVSYISAVLIAVIVLGIIFTRFLFNYGLTWAYEVIQMLLLVLIFMSLTYILQIGRHIRVTAVVSRMPAKARNIAALFARLIELAFCIFFTVVSAQTTLLFYRMGSVSPYSHIPFFVPRLGIAVGLFLLSLQLVAEVARQVGLMVKGEAAKGDLKTT